MASWAILAQAPSPPAIMSLFWVVLWCAGSFQLDVSGAVRRNAHGHHHGAEGSLWVAQRSLGGLHCNCRRLKEDTRLLAVLPGHVVTAALERSQLGDGSCLSAVQASHVGLGWNLARRIQHTKNGGDWDSWTDFESRRPRQSWRGQWLHPWTHWRESSR